VWSYAGIRPLYDDHAANASAVTRDYVLDFDRSESQAPMLSVFGGKITTYRKLAEHAMEHIAPLFPQAGAPWTAGATLPGGDLPDGDFDGFVAALVSRYPQLDPALLHRLARAYGTRALDLLGTAKTPGKSALIWAGACTPARLIISSGTNGPAARRTFSIAAASWGCMCRKARRRRWRPIWHAIDLSVTQVKAKVARRRW
jgi:glycerol-3-phosphate dehydrogenase